MRDEEFFHMDEALALAERGVGWCSPNPPVGAVVVGGNGLVLGRGWHRAAGGPHAEVVAIDDAGGPDAVRGATLFVTLEPCSTHGRTPPCVDLIRSSGIRRVLVGTSDPNPAHAGAGLDILRQAGIEVVCGVREAACRRLIRGFARRVTTGRPWVLLKAAVSLDGKLARPAGESRWLTGEAARADAHMLRAQSDAVLAGAGTLLADDPLLTVRLPGASTGHGRKPLRVILAGRRALPSSARVFHDEPGGEVLVLEQLSASDVVDELGRRGIGVLMLEGGAGVYQSFIEAGLVDEVVVYVAPVLCGAGAPASFAPSFGSGSLALRRPQVEVLGGDTRISGFLSDFAADWLRLDEAVEAG